MISIQISRRKSKTYFHICFLGKTPGPGLLGFIIDSACTIWQVDCGETGFCWTYNKHDLGLRIMIWWLILKAMGVIFFSLLPSSFTNLHQRIHKRWKSILSNIT